ncbi:hypothetical protein BDV96DRAFT_463662, partial [Lophiotrema nucula]
MAAPRLPFLWPILFKPTLAPRAIRRINPRQSQISKSFATTTRRRDTPNAQRYGTAQEPAPHLREQQKLQEGEEQTNKPQASKQSPPESNSELVKEAEEAEPPTATAPQAPPQPELEKTEAPSSPAPEPVKAPESKPLNTILHMPSPQEVESHKPPHLKTPPYVHHFDTYGLVKDLAKSGFSQEQAVSIMKAVRGILTDNMELAREGLVSKSHVENEAYLFKAACSELKTEIGNKRKGEMETMRTERNQLQHELDLLNQKLGQETGNLKDELKGLFDDRKMAVRQEQRTQEAKIQELNYHITVALNSDSRSEVEGLRWVLTRRAAITVGITAFMLFAALRYTSYVAHKEQEEKKKANERRPPRGDGFDGPNPNNPGSGGPGKQDALGGELLATEG